MGKNENLNYEVLDNTSNGVTVTGTTAVTNLLAVVPNAIAAPIQRFHEVEVKKDVVMKVLEHQTRERDRLCDLIQELAQMNQLDSEKFQTIMVAYGMKRF